MATTSAGLFAAGCGSGCLRTQEIQRARGIVRLPGCGSSVLAALGSVTCVRVQHALQICTSSSVHASLLQLMWGGHCAAVSGIEHFFALHVEMQVRLVEQAVQDTVWRQQVNQVHQQLLDQQKHKAALRQRLQQDAQRAKREQLRRIEPVAKARARTHGLANLGWDPEILALSDKFGRLNRLVDEVQQRMEAQYGLIGAADTTSSLGTKPWQPSLDDAAASGLPPPAAAAWAEAADHGRHPQMLQARVHDVGQQQGRMPQVQQQQQQPLQQEQQQVTAWLRQGLQPGPIAAKAPAQLQQRTELEGMQANTAQQQLTPGPNMWQQLSRPDPQHHQHTEYPLRKPMANIQHPSQP